MTEELREKYTEDKVHYEVIRAIIKEEIKPINKRQDWFYTAALLVFGFLFGVQFFVWKELSAKANNNETLSKLQYYQLEVDEHRMMKEIFVNPSRSVYVFDQINSNIEMDLGFKYINRGIEK